MRQALFQPAARITKKFLFYDLETTGLNHVFDRAVRFAAIVTNDQLEEIKRIELNIRLPKDVIPHPAAIRVNRITLSQMQEGLSDYEGLKAIHTLMNEPNMINIGYNSAGYDNRILQASFYRNFLSPYTHQFKNGCRSWDLYPMAVYAATMCDVGLQWPSIEGKNTFRLEEINKANQLITSGQAHTAITDTEVTLELARRLFKHKKLWDRCAQFFDNAQDRGNIINCQALEDFQVGGVIQHRSSDIFSTVMVLNLSATHVSFLKLDDVSRATLLTNPKPFIIEKKLGQPCFFVPFQDLLPHQQHACVALIPWITQNRHLLEKIADHSLSRNFISHPMCDEYGQLYGLPFTTHREEALFASFHRALPANKLSIAKQFPHETQRELALRWMGNHFYDDLSKEDQEKFDVYLAKHFSSDDCPAVDCKGDKQLNFSYAQRALNDCLLKNNDAEQVKILEEYQEWLSSRLMPTQESTTVPVSIRR